MQLVIIAGGKGTRLKQVIGDLPKPMVQIGGKPLLEHQILLAHKYGIRDILLLIGHGAQHIQNYFGDGKNWGVRISYHEDAAPLGTGGALLNALDRLEDEFLVMYGDTMLNVDLGKFIGFFHQSTAPILFVHPNDHPQDSDLIELDDGDNVTAMHPYPHPPSEFFANLVNAALYVFSRSHIEGLASDWNCNAAPLDICKHLFPRMLQKGMPLRGYRSREYIKDAGTPERLERVRKHFEAGRIHNGSLDTPAPAIFLDRDGTLNLDHGWIDKPENIQLLPGAAQAIKAIHEAGYLAVIVTNQPVIARGACTESGLKKIHDKLEWLLGLEHAYVDAIYYCPHHPDSGFPGERPELKFSCTCRKPKTGMFTRAMHDLNINLQASWMIGDSESDIKAAENLKIPAIFLSTTAPNPVNGPSPRAQVGNVLDAVNHILSFA